MQEGAVSGRRPGEDIVVFAAIIICMAALNGTYVVKEGIPKYILRQDEIKREPFDSNTIRI